MPAAPSALKQLLRVRQHRRDACRLALVELELRSGSLQSQLDAIEFERESELTALRPLESRGMLDVAALLARRQHLDLLSRESDALKSNRQELTRQIADQTDRLLRCDREVQSLEKLLSTRTADAIAARRRWESRELDDVGRSAVGSR
jgi:flagellar export protein FliJ